MNTNEKVKYEKFKNAVERNRKTIQKVKKKQQN